MTVDVRAQDCIAGMAALPVESVDVCVTSPPYNIGVKYRTYKDTQHRTEYLKWSMRWIDEVFRVLDTNGSFFLNLGGCPRDPFLPHEIIILLREKWYLQNTFHWIKAISIDGNETTHAPTISRGHFKPINSKRFVNDCHEYVFHLTKTGSVPIDRKGVGVPYVDQSNIKRWAHSQGNNLRCRGNTWFIPYRTIHDRKSQRDHPATFPVALPAMCLRLHSPAASSLRVLDPFVGLGSSLVAAQQHIAQSFTGFDIDEFYVKTTLSKITLL